jgi:hypothetical protein
MLAGLRARMLLLLLLTMPAGRSAWADIDHSEYETKTALGNTVTQRRYLEQIAAERREEARREAERAEAARREAEARRLAEEARPWPERLTERHCTACHAATNYTLNGHTHVGWWLVVLRMKEVNKAPLSWDEAAVIVPYLAEHHPASGADRWLEWSLLASALAAPVGAGYAVRRLLGRKTG